MATRIIFMLVVIVGAIVAPLAVAESTDCTTPVLIVVDGRITQSNFPQNVTYWYGIYAQAGHSYSVEFVPAADNYLNVVHAQLGSVGVFGPNDNLQACRGTSSLAVTQNSGYSPVLRNGNGTGRRVSFTAQSAGLHLISLTNLAGSGTYSFRAVDTTLFSPRWSTCGGYDDHWGFLNVSDMTIIGILTIFDASGNVLASAQLNIPAGTVRLKFSFPSDMNIPRNSAGYATFSHNGPPESIVADAYMANLTLGIVFASKFEARGPQ